MPTESTSLSVVGGPDERLTWSGNGAVWTKGAELVRSFVFEPDELVAAAAFASFSLESAACRASEDVSGGQAAAVAEAASDRSVPTPQPPARARARPSQVRRSSQARGPRVSEGASFVRQSTHPPAQADSSAFLQAPAPSAPLASVPAASGCAGAPLASKLRRRSSGPQTRALCFLFNDALQIHLASGERHILPLPCATEPSLQAIEGGGLALRSSQPDADVSFLEGGSLFVVRNPLDGFVLVGSDEKSVIAPSGAAEAASGPAAQTAADQVPVELLLESGHVVTAQASQTTIRVPANPAFSRPAVSAKLESTVELSGRQAWVPGLNRLDTLIRDCLRALDGVLAAEDLCGLQLNSIRSAGHASASSDESTRFASFTTALLDVLARDRSQPSPEPPARLSPWERIVSFNELSRDPALWTLARSPLSSATPANNGTHAPVDLTRTAAVVLALHLLAEDYRLDILRFQDLHVLGGLVAKLALAIGRSDWADHWFRQGCLSPVRDVHVASAGIAIDASLPSPPDIYAHLRVVLAGRASISTPWPVAASVPTSPPCLASTLIGLYGTLSSVSPDSAGDRSADVVNAMVDSGLTKERLLRIPFGLALPLMAAVKTCQTAPLASWSPAVFKLIRRPDLGDPPHSVPVPKPLVSEPVSTRSLSRPSKKGVAAPLTAPSLALRFGSDRRLEEVERLLSTTRTSTFRLRDESGLSEEDIAAQQKAQAGMLISRTLALPVGQGMLTYATSSAVITTAFDIPPIETTVKTAREGGTQVVPGPVLEPEMSTWPDFANGVAQVLQIRADSNGIDNSWIAYNKPRDLTASHGGFLLGLGLTGHLRKMTRWLIYQYFDARHEPTSVGLLLGLGASHLASCDPRLTNTMSLHVHALLPHGSRDLHSSPLIQSAALVGIGLLYLGSGNRSMAEVALSEVSRQCSSEEAPTEAQAYAFAAAMTFGLIMLGRGGEATRSGDPLLVSRLRTLIDGRATASEDGPGGLGRAKAVKPDLNVTSAPATLTLGLMYLRTGRQEIAGILEIPQAANDLQFVRPDLLFTRTLARSLILWDDIADSEAWIDSNLPAFLRSPLGKRQRDAPSLGVQQTLDLARFNILAGACFALALKYAGTARWSVHSLLLSTYDVFYARATVNASTFQQRIRLNAARSCLCVVALSLAIVMAGTGELSVMSRLRLAHGQHERFGYGVQQAVHMSLGLLFLGKGLATVGNSPTAVAAMVCAFYPNFNIDPSDNASYPQAFRHLWALAVEPRCLIARDVESREPVYLPVKVKTEEKGAYGSHHLISPTLLPPLDRLVSVTIDSPRYWPLVLDLRQKRGRSPTILDHHRPLEGIYVKRRAGYLSYADDPKGNRTLFVKAGLANGLPEADLGSMSIAPVAQEGLASLRQSVAAYTSNPFLLAFVRRLCAPSASAPAPSKDLQQFCESALLEGLVNDQPQLIALYLHIRHVGRLSAAAPHLLPAVLMQNLRLALDLIDGAAGALAGQSTDDERRSAALLRLSFLRETTDAMTAPFAQDLARGGSLRTHLQRYLGDVGSKPDDQTAQDELALYLTSAGVPALPVLASLRDVVLEARAYLGGLAGGGGQGQDAMLRLLVKATLGRLRNGGHTMACQAGDRDLGWVDAALEVWR